MKANYDDVMFLVFNKQRGVSNFEPIYKTEGKKPADGKFNYNTVSLGTDTMFSGKDDQNCTV